MSAELVPVDTTTGEIVETHDVDSWVNVVADVARLAEHIATTEFVPRGLRNNIPATTAAILYGRELGLPPMTALSQIAVIEGKPTLYAEGMRALVLAAGHDIEIVKSTTAECVVRGRRRGSTTWSEPVTWNGDNVRAAGLAGRDPWKKYPRQMLVARATAELCRNVFPDVIHGFRSAEEITDIGDDTPPPEAPAPASASTTRVARKRGTKKATAGGTTTPGPLPPAVPDPDEGPVLPPLPVEDIPVAPEPTPPVPETYTVEELPRTEDPRPARHRPNDPDADVPLPEEMQPAGTGQPKRPALEPDKRRVRDIVLHFGRLGLDPDDRDTRLMLTGRVVGRDIGSTSELSPDEQEYVLATLRVLKTLADLKTILDVTDDTPEEPPE